MYVCIYIYIYTHTICYMDIRYLPQFFDLTVHDEVGGMTNRGGDDSESFNRLVYIALSRSSIYFKLIHILLPILKILAMLHSAACLIEPRSRICIL